jgi:hypothetical protein
MRRAQFLRRRRIRRNEARTDNEYSKDTFDHGDPPWPTRRWHLSRFE